jgi:hypothetical protein
VEEVQASESAPEASRTTKKRGGIQDRLAGKGKRKAENNNTPKLRIDDKKLDDDFVTDSDAQDEEDDEIQGAGFWDAEDEEPEDGIEENIDPQFMNWNFNTPPVQPNKEFCGNSGPQHNTLSPQNATPFDYFSLFIPSCGPDLPPIPTERQ